MKKMFRKTKFDSIVEMKEAVEAALKAIPRETLVRAVDNGIKRYKEVLEVNGEHFEYRLKKSGNK